jgi:predicted nucleic acid-binding protein
MVGVLIEAKNKGYIQSIKPYMEKLRNTGFRMSEDLYQMALNTADESKNKRQW